MRALPLALLCALLLPAASAGQGDESSKTAQQIVADVTRDLGAVHSYHVTAIERTRSATGTVVGDVDASGPMRFRVRQGGETFALIATKSATFVKANRAFWRQEGHVKSAKALKLLSGRWIKVPASQDLQALVTQFAPATLARCFSSDRGTVTKRGTTTFAGLHVIVLADKGDKPGTTPALLYITSAGRILPVRMVQTGRQRPGGHPCGGSDKATRHGDLRLSHFDKPVHVGAPAKALDITKVSPS